VCVKDMLGKPSVSQLAEVCFESSVETVVKDRSQSILGGSFQRFFNIDKGNYLMLG